MYPVASVKPILAGSKWNYKQSSFGVYDRYCTHEPTCNYLSISSRHGVVLQPPPIPVHTVGTNSVRFWHPRSMVAPTEGALPKPGLPNYPQGPESRYVGWSRYLVIKP